MTNTNQKGFTLVEIAIVLVIIGLLLGGVLQGQTLIKNAKVKSAASDINGYQVALYGYQDRFGDLFDVRNHVAATAAQQALTTVVPADSQEMLNELVARELVGSRGISNGVQQHALSGNVQLYKQGDTTAPAQGTHDTIALTATASPAQFRWAVCYESIQSDDDARALIRSIDGASTAFPAAYTTGNARLVTNVDDSDTAIATVGTFAATTADTVCFNLQ